MAEEKEKNPNQEQEQGAKRRLPMKTILVLAAVLLVEGLAISLAFMFAGRPTPVQAELAAEDAIAAADTPVELLIVADRFQNTRSGRTYIYETEVWVVVRRKHEGSATTQIEQMNAQLTADIATIFRRAEPSYLLDPNLATLHRQIKAAVDDRLGKDENGKPITDEVLIKKFMQFRADI